MIQFHSPAPAPRAWRPLRSATIVLLAGVIAGAIALAVSALVLTKTYTSVSTVLVDPKPTTTSSSSSLFVDDQSVGKTFEELASQPVVAADTARRLGTTLDTVSKHVALHAVPKTPLLEIRYTADSRSAATLGARTYANTFLDAVKRGQWLTVDATLVSPATEPLHPSSPRTLLNTVVGTMAGMVVAAALLFQAAATRAREAAAAVRPREELALPYDGLPRESTSPLQRSVSRSRR